MQTRTEKQITILKDPNEIKEYLERNEKQGFLKYAPQMVLQVRMVKVHVNLVTRSDLLDLED